MSFYRYQMSIISRGNGGSAVRRSAYQRCAESENGDFDYSFKEDEFVHSEIMLPDLAPTAFRNPDALWEAAESAEKRVDAQLARTLDIAIPAEVPGRLHVDFARELMQLYLQHGFAAEFSIHDAETVFKGEAERNVHIHAMISLRETTAEGFAAKKNRDFNNIMRREGGHYMRRQAADTMNAFFEKNGIDAHVDHNKKEDREAIKPEASKHVIREIRRQKEAFKAHIDAEKPIADFPDQLSPSATKFLQARAAHEKALTAREVAIDRARKIHEGISRKTLDEAHTALDEYMKTGRVHEAAFSNVNKTAKDINEDALTHGDIMLLKLAEIRMHNMREESPDSAYKQHSEGVTKDHMVAFENTVKSYQKAHNKNRTTSRCDQTASNIAQSISTGDFAMLIGSGDEAVSAFLKAWSSSMRKQSLLI